MASDNPAYSVVSDGIGTIANFRFLACANEYLERSFKSGAFNLPLTVRHKGEVVSAFWNERQVVIDRDIEVRS